MSNQPLTSPLQSSAPNTTAGPCYAPQRALPSAVRKVQFTVLVLVSFQKVTIVLGIGTSDSESSALPQLAELL